MNPLELHISATALPYLACEQAYKWRVLEGWETKEDSEALSFGSAFHTFAQHWTLGAHDASVRALAEYKGTDMFTLGAAMGVLQSTPKPTPACDLNGAPCVEVRFKHLLREFSIRGRDVHVYVTGVIDLLEYDAAGNLVIVDYKTTRSWKPADYLLKCKRTAQNLLYQWFLAEYGHTFLPLTLANWAHEGKLYSIIRAVFIKSKPLRIMDSDRILFDAYERKQFGMLLDNACERAALLATMERDPLKDGIVSNKCSFCDYSKVCTLGEGTLPAYFQRKDKP